MANKLTINMSSRYGAGVVLLAACVLLPAIFGAMAVAQPAPAPAVDCTSVVFTLTDCLGYVTGSVKTPPAACCTELAGVVSSSPQCLCLLYNTTFTGPLGVNVTIAQQLPTVCKVQTPPTSFCTALGVPVPGPVTASAPAPLSTSAPAAMTPAAITPASSPLSSSSSPSPISPTSAPLGAPAAAVPASTPAPSTPSVSPTPAATPVGSITPTGAPLSEIPSPTTTPTTNSPPGPAPSAAFRPSFSAAAPLGWLSVLAVLLV